MKAKIIKPRTRIALAAETEKESLAVTLTILSGQKMSRWDLGEFVVDLTGITVDKDPLMLDYDHNTQEPIGTIGNIRVTDAGLVGDAEIFSTRPDDRAADVIRRMQRGTPYECSPFLELVLESARELGTSETLEVNGETVQGLTVYEKAKLLGVAVCPYGTDSHTGAFSGAAQLNRGGEQMDEKEVKVNPDVPADAGEGDPGYNAHQDLEEMIEAFGLERGVAFFRRGLSMAEAQKEDYEELKAARRAAEEEKDGNDGGGGGDGGEEDEKKNGGVAELRRTVDALAKRIDSMASLNRRGAQSLSCTPADAGKTKSGNPALDYANRLKK